MPWAVSLRCVEYPGNRAAMTEPTGVQSFIGGHLSGPLSRPTLGGEQFANLPDGGPALEASWSHPTLKKAMALALRLASPHANPVLVTVRPDEVSERR